MSALAMINKPFNRIYWNFGDQRGTYVSKICYFPQRFVKTFLAWELRQLKYVRSTDSEEELKECN